MSEIPSEVTAESLDITVEEVFLAFAAFPDFIPIILRHMLSRGLIDLDKCHNREYLLSVVSENIEEVAADGLEHLVNIHDEFLEVAEDAIAANKPEVAIILIATIVEHLLNLYYRELLAYKGLPSKEITQVIRSSNIEAKMGWLMSLTGQLEFPEGLRKRIDEVVQLRNAIVHYKAVPSRFDVEEGSWEKIRDRIRRVDFDDLLAILHELDNTLESALDEVDPNRRLAKELASKELGWTRDVAEALRRVASYEPLYKNAPW